MNRSFSFGLIGRIILALALVFTLLIILNELTVTSVVHVTLKNAHLENQMDTDALQQKKGEILSGIRRPVIVYTVTAAVLSLLLASFAIHRIAVKPLRRITKAFEDLADGHKNVHVPVEGAFELILLASNFNKMMDTIKAQKSELEQQLRELEQTTEHLKNTQNDLIRAAGLASVGTLASGVAHEIGNPVTGVLGLVEALKTESNPETARTYHELIEKEMRRIDKTIRDLLSFARPNPPDAPAHTQLQPVLTHVYDLVRVQKAFYDVRLHVEPVPSLPPLAIGTNDLTAVLVNLCLNAAQAINGKGEITIWIESEPPDAAPPTQAVIHVRDSGPGIADDIADQIFEPFFTRRRAGDGSGLGLAICQSICERNFGSIRLDHDTETGAHFVIHLPIFKE